MIFARVRVRVGLGFGEYDDRLMGRPGEDYADGEFDGEVNPSSDGAGSVEEELTVLDFTKDLIQMWCILTPESRSEIDRHPIPT